MEKQKKLLLPSVLVGVKAAALTSANRLLQAILKLVTRTTCNMAGSYLVIVELSLPALHVKRANRYGGAPFLC